MSRVLFVSMVVSMIVALGCGGRSSAPEREWQIVAENQSDTPCTIAVVLGGGQFHDAKVENLPKGKPHIMLAAVPKVIVKSVKKDDQELKPDVEVPVGKKYSIIVAPDGKLSASLTD